MPQSRRIEPPNYSAITVKLQPSAKKLTDTPVVLSDGSIMPFEEVKRRIISYVDESDRLIAKRMIQEPEGDVSDFSP
jgi:hypothetical protein